MTAGEGNSFTPSPVVKRPALATALRINARTPQVKFSQAAAKELPVADLDGLTSAQIRRLAKGFDDVVKATARGEGLLPMPLMTEDPTRKMLDDAVSDALGMGDLYPLRAALAQEPIIVSRPVAGD